MCYIRLEARFLWRALSTTSATDIRVFLYDRRAANDSAVWKWVQPIRDHAEKCSRKHMDEQACRAVVRLVLDLSLDLAGGASDTDFALEINDIRSQSPSRSFLPRSGDFQYTDRKTDFVIAVDMDKGTHVKANPNLLCLSPMTDAYTERTSLLCGIEIKDFGGNEEDTHLQLMIWRAAMLAHLNYLQWTQKQGRPFASTRHSTSTRCRMDNPAR
jgi:hypothetical protein